jgi:hypothetical protein
MHALPACLSAAGLVIAVSSLVAAFPFSARAQSFNTFDDWMLGCDNLRHCVAVGLEPDENVNGVYLRVLRGVARKSTPWGIRHALADCGRCKPALDLPLGACMPVQAAMIVFAVTLFGFARGTR